MTDTSVNNPHITPQERAASPSSSHGTANSNGSSPIRKTLAGWGNSPALECRVTRPETMPAMARNLRNHTATLLARGLGSAYGDAALNPQGTLLTERLDRFLSFDRTRGIVRVQAGISLAVLMDIIVPNGWIMPVITGTKYVSLGGMVACDAHGKNHEHHGTIGNHIRKLTLRLADGSRVKCSPTQKAELFLATLGGMGLTGIIEDVTLQLHPIHSLSLRKQSRRVPRLADMIALFEESHGQHDYRIGWIDHMTTGGELGRGVFEKADHISVAEGGLALEHYEYPQIPMDVPTFAPEFLLNKYTMKLYNERRFIEYGNRFRTETVFFDPFFHPLDRLGHWNRLYGKRGLLQFHGLFPQQNPEALVENMETLLRKIHHAGQHSFLAVLKYHAEEAPSYLSFPQPGYSLELDFPNTPQTRTLLHSLHEDIIALDGRVYLAKDATLTPEQFARMYGGKKLSQWRDTLAHYDPNHQWHSAMAERLNLRNEAP